MEFTPKSPAETLISALKERDISVKRGEIEATFSDEASKAENAKWVSEHVNYNTLLTREELDLYELFFSSLNG